MTTSNEQVAKLPLMKRIVLALRGGVPNGVSAMLVVLLIALVIAIGAGGFLGGLALATQRNQTMERNLLTQTRAAKQAAAKLAEEKAQLQTQLEEAKTLQEAKDKDVATLKEQLALAKLEKEALDKVLQDIRTSLTGTGSKAEQAVKGALLKFADKECELQGGAIRSKEDVKCLNLRDAIGAMNSGPGGYEDKPAKPATPAPAPAVKPAAPKPATPKPSGH